MVFRDDRRHLGCLHPRGDRRRIKPEIGGEGREPLDRHVAAEGGVEAVVELRVGLGPRDLKRRDGEARGDHGLFAEDREFLDDAADVAVAFDQPCGFGMRLSAVAAAVVDELDEGHAAFGVSADEAVAVGEDGAGVGLHKFGIAGRLLGLLARFQKVRHLDEEVWIGEEVVADFLVQRGAFGIRHGRDVEGGGATGREKGGGGGECEGEAAHGTCSLDHELSRSG